MYIVAIKHEVDRQTDGVIGIQTDKQTEKKYNSGQCRL